MEADWHLPELLSVCGSDAYEDYSVKFGIGKIKFGREELTDKPKKRGSTMGDINTHLLHWLTPGLFPQCHLLRTPLEYLSPQFIVISFNLSEW
jgi:hypothetical protein